MDRVCADGDGDGPGLRRWRWTGAAPMAMELLYGD